MQNLSNLTEISHQYWENLRPQEVVQGLNIDIGLIQKYLPRVEREPGRPDLWPWFYDIYELGAGNGELSDRLANVGHYSVHAIDINPSIQDVSVVDYDSPKFLYGAVGDVTQWSQGIGKDSILRLERIDAVVAQAVMPSLLGDNGLEWKKMLDSAAMWVAPSKYIFLNDFRAADYYYSPLAKQLGPAEWQSQMNTWHQRYKRNQDAFGNLGLPNRAFAVGKPGTEGKFLELGNPRQLQELYRRKDLFERFAQHVDPIEVNLHMRRLGFTLLEENYSSYKSRGASKLLAPQVLQVWQKGSKYQYDHVSRGLDVNDASWEQQALEKYHALKETCEKAGVSYFRTAAHLVAVHAPKSQFEAVMKLGDQFK